MLLWIASFQNIKTASNGRFFIGNKKNGSSKSLPFSKLFRLISELIFGLFS
jgi:hypothetical protein